MILVIGYGNPLCGDDGIGPYAVEQLAQAGENLRGDVEWLTVRQLTPELAEPISRAATVIFVDAADGETPGEMICHTLTASKNQAKTVAGAFTHHVQPTVLLENAQLLYGQRPLAAYLYTITGKNFNLGDGFSPAIDLALPSFLDTLKRRIADSQMFKLILSAGQINIKAQKHEI